MNVGGRIHPALGQIIQYGGEVIQTIQLIGPYGFRPIIAYSEGNAPARRAQADT